MVNKERLWNHLMELGEIGLTEGKGTSRFAFTDQDMEAKELVKSYMKQAGLSVWEDAMGNLFGHKEGKQNDAPMVMMGSHIDTVACGGRFDGILGVLAGIEVLHTMNENGVSTEFPITICVFKDEEGARFGFDMLGSRSIAGMLREEDLLRKDKDGITIAEAMKGRGYRPEDYKQAVMQKGSIKAFIELHIEQGKVLESKNLPTGIVTGIYSSLWMGFTIKGKADHAGGTPMNMRKDALVAASKVIQYVNERAISTGTGVGTVGRINALPGGINIIPGEVSFTIDLRAIEDSVAQEMEQDIIKYAETICQENGLEFGPVEYMHKLPPTPCDPELQKVIAAAFVAAGQEVFHLPSGPGHDAMRIAKIAPIGIIFVRCKEGLSHCPEEWTSPEDCEIAGNVLYHTILKLAHEK